MTESLNISVIGGGLAGALTARVLRERRYTIAILELTTDPLEVGAAINVVRTVYEFSRNMDLADTKLAFQLGGYKIVTRTTKCCLATK